MDTGHRVLDHLCDTTANVRDDLRSHRHTELLETPCQTTEDLPDLGIGLCLAEALAMQKVV